MKKYAKIINEETKCCEVGTGTNERFYQSIGMTEMDVQQAYDGLWYLEGYVPEKPVEQKQKEVRDVRNSYLKDTDKYMISDYPITSAEREKYKSYRQYLRDYTLKNKWWLTNPLNFDEWKSVDNSNNVDNID